MIEHVSLQGKRIRMRMRAAQSKACAQRIEARVHSSPAPAQLRGLLQGSSQGPVPVASACRPLTVQCTTRSSLLPQFKAHQERAGLGLELLPGVRVLLETLKVCDT